MKDVLEIAELLVAAWVLGAHDPQRPGAIPTSHGVLDRALKMAVQDGAFSEWGQRLHFADSRVGLQCVELPEVLTCAQRAEFTTAPNPSYRQTDVRVGPSVARRILARRRIDASAATEWGRKLHEAVTHAKQVLENYPRGTIDG